MLVALSAASAMAGSTDQLQCYRVKDPLQLIGLADLSPPQLAPSSGCTLSKATLLCVPTTGTPGTIFDRSTNLPITPGLVSGLSEGDRVCYKARCRGPASPDSIVTDEFGTRTVMGLRTSLYCVPAFLGSAHYTDNGDGTVTDNYTGLQWEQKVPGSGCLHCVDDTYTWADAMAEFISQVNGVTSSTFQTGLGGHSDWRLPTVSELQRLAAGPSPCTNPCVDPVVGPAIGGFYWSSTTDASDASLARGWYFTSSPNPGLGAKSGAYAVRAVRGGS